MSRTLSLEAFGARAAPAELAPPPPPPSPESTELWRMGYEAGLAEGRDAGYAAGAAAAGAEHKAVLAVASEAVARARQEREAAEAALRRDAAIALRSALGAIAPGLLERGFLEEAAATLEDWVGGVAEADGMLVVAPETRTAMRDALADDPALSQLEIAAEPGLGRFQIRFEWRLGQAELDAGAVAEKALEIIDAKIVEAEQATVGKTQGDERRAHETSRAGAASKESGDAHR